MLILPIRYTVEKTRLFSRDEKHPQWAKALKELARQDAQALSKTVIFDDPHAVEAMFYTGATVYRVTPHASVIDTLKHNGWRVLIYEAGKYVER